MDIEHRLRLIGAVLLLGFIFVSARQAVKDQTSSGRRQFNQLILLVLAMFWMVLNDLK